MMRGVLRTVTLGALVLGLCACSGGGPSGGGPSGSGSGAAAGGANTGGGINVGGGVNTGGINVGGIGGGVQGGGIKLPGTGTPGGTPAPTPNAEAWATNTLNDLVEIFDLRQSQSVATIPVNGPLFIEHDPGAGRMLVVNTDKELRAYDVTSHSQQGLTVDLTAGDMTQFPAISFLDGLLRPVYFPSGCVTVNGLTFVPGLICTTVVQNGQKVRSIIDIDNAGAGTVTGLSLLNARIESLGAYAAAQSGGRVYVTNLFSSTVTVIDPALVLVPGADPVVDTIPIVGSAASGGSAMPTAIVADDQGKLYVTCFLSGDVAVIDTHNNNSVTYLPMVGVGPIAATFYPGGTAGAKPAVYIANFFDGTVIEIDTQIGLVANTYQVHGAAAFFAMMGMSPQQFQAMLQQAFGQLGLGSANGTTTGGAANFMSSLLAMLTGSQGGVQGAGGLMFALVGQLMQTAFQQAGIGTGQGGIAGTFMQMFQQIPVPGLTDVAVTRNGTIVAGSIFGAVSVYDPIARSGATINSNAAMTSNNPNGGIPLAGLQAVAVRDR